MPLGALPEGDGSFLVETHAFAYVEDAVTLAQLLAGSASREDVAPTVLLVGGVD